MKILNPHPGYVIDRLAILDLKIAAATEASINPIPFQAEKVSLENYLRGWESCLVEEWAWDVQKLEERQGKINRDKNGLTAVNALLWEAQDKVRELSEMELTKLAFLAKRIAKLSDARSEMIRELNDVYGAGKNVEKIFGVSIGRTETPSTQMKLKFV
jgi:hypothetical protein